MKNGCAYVIQYFVRVLSLAPDCLYDSICVYDKQNTQGHEPVPVRVVKKEQRKRSD